MEHVKAQITALRQYFPKSFDDIFWRLRAEIDLQLVELAEAEETVGEIKGNDLGGIKNSWRHITNDYFKDLRQEIFDYIKLQFPIRWYSDLELYRKGDCYKYGYYFSGSQMAEKEDRWWHEKSFSTCDFDWEIELPQAVLEDPLTKKLVAAKRVIKANNLPYQQTTTLIHTWRVYVYEKYFLPLAQEREQQIIQQFKQKKDEIKRTSEQQSNF